MTRRREALRAMAEQDVSPNERDIARAKLEAMGAWPPPPAPPAPASSPSPEPYQPHFAFHYTATTSSAVGNAPFNTGFVFIRITLP